MRDAFTKALSALAREHEDIFLITGDLGFGVLTPFKNEFPTQYLNAGIAEQAMTGMAAGMALEGRTVFTYSIGNFPTLRPLEQIRNDCAYHGANVKIVCVGGGFVYGSLGMSHHATEDVSIMRALPNVTVFSPGDPYEVEALMPLVYSTPGTCYLRLGRGGEPFAHEAPIENYKLGQAVELYSGKEGAVFSTGGILTECKKAVSAMREAGRDIGLYSFPTVKPLDKHFIQAMASKLPFIATVEEHNIVGGFGSAVCEATAAMSGPRAKIELIGLDDCYSAIVGSQQYLRHFYGFDSEHIIKRITALL
jgi:Transketolase, C-terminal subunit